MRWQIVFLLLLLPTFIFAAELKEVQEFFAQSAELRTAAAKETGNAKKLALLKKLKTSLANAHAAYKKMNPKEADASEDKVTFFDLTFRPLFEMKNLNAKECRTAEYTVKSDDKMGKAEDATLSPEATEALEWLKVLCPPK